MEAEFVIFDGCIAFGESNTRIIAFCQKESCLNNMHRIESALDVELHLKI